MAIAAAVPAVVVDSGVSSAATSNNVNVQNSVDSSSSSVVNSVVEQQQQPESATSSQIAVQQEILQVSQDASVAPSLPSQPPSSPQSIAVVPVDPQSVQLLKEANAQYQYQINSRYEEKTRPIYGDVPQHQQYLNHQQQQQQQQQLYANSQPHQNNMYFGFAPSASSGAYPYYKENVQYQELGNGQRRAETVVSDNVRTQYENQDAYNHQRSQSYSEYGKGELSPDYNTYSYKRTYY